MPSRQEIESARRRMLEARRALEDHQKVMGFKVSVEYYRLSKAFKKAAKKYLDISQPKRQ